MAMYALAIVPLIHKLRHSSPDVKQAWYADDATGAGSCEKLRHWWDQLLQAGPTFSYFPNSTKTYLIVKEEYESKARELFSADTEVHVTTDGKRHLGAALGLHRRVCFGKGQRMGQRNQASISSSVHSTSCSLCCFHSWSLQSLDLYLQDYTRYSRSAPPPGDSHPSTPYPCPYWTRSLLCGRTRSASPPRQTRRNGIGQPHPTSESTHAFEASKHVTAPLVALIVRQELHHNPQTNDLRKVKKQCEEK